MVVLAEQAAVENVMFANPKFFSTTVLEHITSHVQALSLITTALLRRTKLGRNGISLLSLHRHLEVELRAAAADYLNQMAVSVENGRSLPSGNLEPAFEKMEFFGGKGVIENDRPRLVPPVGGVKFKVSLDGLNHPVTNTVHNELDTVLQFGPPGFARVVLRGQLDSRMVRGFLEHPWNKDYGKRNCKKSKWTPANCNYVMGRGSPCSDTPQHGTDDAGGRCFCQGIEPGIGANFSWIYAGGLSSITPIVPSKVPFPAG